MSFELALNFSFAAVSFLLMYFSFNFGKNSQSKTDDINVVESSFNFEKIWTALRMFTLFASLLMMMPLISVNYEHISENITGDSITRYVHFVDAAYQWFPMFIYFMIIVIVVIYVASVLQALAESRRR